MKVVIDTNVLINCISSRTRVSCHLASIFDRRNYFIRISRCIAWIWRTGIAEISFKNCFRNYRHSSWPNFVKQKDIYYYWNAISIDKDDNKFFDTAVASGAEYIVTNDNHFKSAKRLSFPKVNIISADDFLQILKSLFDE